eukprot:278994-Chlamydomonas_euryale.AAC.5
MMVCMCLLKQRGIRVWTWCARACQAPTATLTGGYDRILSSQGVPHSGIGSVSPSAHEFSPTMFDCLGWQRHTCNTGRMSCGRWLPALQDTQRGMCALAACRLLLRYGYAASSRPLGSTLWPAPCPRLSKPQCLN